MSYIEPGDEVYREGYHVCGEVARIYLGKTGGGGTAVVYLRRDFFHNAGLCQTPVTRNGLRVNVFPPGCLSLHRRTPPSVLGCDI